MSASGIHARCKVLALYRLSAYEVFCQCKLVLAVEQANESQRSGRFDEEVGHPTEVYLCFDPMCSALLVLQPYGSMYGSCIPVMGSMLLCSGSSPEKHASLSSLFHQYRPAEPPQKSMLLCPSCISPAQRSLPRKACFSVPLPSAPRSGASPEKHASLSLFHQHRAAEPPQKSMLLCPSFISPAQRSLPRKACFSVPLPSAPRSGSSPEKRACASIRPLPSAPRSGASPEKHASLPLFHQPRAAEPPQKSMLLCPSSISTAQRSLPRKARMRLYPPTSISTAQRSLPQKACFSAPLPSAPRSGASPEKHASLSLFHQHRAAEAPQKSAHARLSAHFHQHRAAEPPQKSMLLCSSSISTAQRRLPRTACFSIPLPSAPRSGGSP